ncbi:MAG: IS66 family transposase [Gammaproteobacteria bacterium]|nr:IS66 family transposase [Gammaproteobacteria bacterium]
MTKLAELQKADIERLMRELRKPQPNQPERVHVGTIQLALDRVVEQESVAQATSQVPVEPEQKAALAAVTASDAENAKKKRNSAASRAGSSAPHGRRDLKLENLPQEVITLDPEPVLAANGEGYEFISDEVGRRLGYRPASYVCIVIRRGKYRLIERRPAATELEPDAPTNEILIAPLPDNILPLSMADASAIGRHIVAKYGDCLPLHRQEAISAREGFRIPRSTQCGWLGGSAQVCARVVDAMLADAKARAFCIATDATSAPVQCAGRNIMWHMFVLLADRDHVIFRATRHHTSEAVQEILAGYHGHLLADAATVFDALYEDGSVIEVACWFHLRRYFWRGIATDRDRAYEALALISRLFEIDRESREVPMPARTKERALRARPVLRLLDAWIERHRGGVDKRGPLAAAIGYYTNQRDALHRFLDDGRLRLDNNLSEQALRHLVVGRHNWTHFANQTGLDWYAIFRSLIASCALHDLNPQRYLEQLLRLAPHWPVNRVLELSPKYWSATMAGLTDEQKTILVPPWEMQSRFIERPEHRSAAA